MMSNHTRKIAMALAISVSIGMATPGCGAVDKLIEKVKTEYKKANEKVSKFVKATKESAGKLMKNVAKAQKTVSDRMGQLQAKGGKKPPATAPLAATGTVDACQAVTQTKDKMIVNFDDCESVKGEIQLAMAGTDAGFQFDVEYIKFAEGATTDVNYFGMDGKTIWKMTFIGSTGLQILTQDDYVMSFGAEGEVEEAVEPVSDSTTDTTDAEPAAESTKVTIVSLHVLGTQALQFDSDENGNPLIVLAGTSALTDIKNLVTIPFQFTDVKFSPIDCPKGPILGSFSMGEDDPKTPVVKEGLRVVVKGCGDGTINDIKATSSELEALFGSYAESANVIHDGVEEGKDDVAVIGADPKQALNEILACDSANTFDPLGLVPGGDYCSGWDSGAGYAYGSCMHLCTDSYGLSRLYWFGLGYSFYASGSTPTPLGDGSLGLVSISSARSCVDSYLWQQGPVQSQKLSYGDELFWSVEPSKDMANDPNAPYAEPTTQALGLSWDDAAQLFTAGVASSCYTSDQNGYCVPGTFPYFVGEWMDLSTLGACTQEDYDIVYSSSPAAGTQ